MRPVTSEEITNGELPLIEAGISISDADLQNGSPLPGDMIARNPENHDDQWLVATAYFKDNLQEVSDCSTEQMILDRNLTAPRLTPTLIQETIKDCEFHKLTDVLTICVLTLTNGFTVTGESACASPANYNKEVGEKVALGKAKEKIWPLEGYLLKQRLYEKAEAANKYLGS